MLLTVSAAGLVAPDPEIFGTTQGEVVEIGAIVTGTESGPGPSGGGSGSGAGTREYQWIQAPACTHSNFRNDLGHGCGDPQFILVVYCPDGSIADPPWWSRWRENGGPWTSWVARQWYTCPNESPLENAIRHAWATMTITPHTITVQPDQGWTYTTVPTIVYVDRAPRTLRTTLLGTAVTIRARPVTYTWDWGDGTTTRTSDPGAPYPNATVSHVYLHEEQWVTIQLATIWRGQYSTDSGATWNAAPGTATTTSAPVDIYVYNPHVHQVDCDLNGICLSDR